MLKSESENSILKNTLNIFFVYHWVEDVFFSTEPLRKCIKLKGNFHKFRNAISWTANVYMIRGAQPEIFQGSGGFVELGHF